MSDKHRVVSVGERRNRNRLLDVVASAVDDIDGFPMEWREKVVVAVAMKVADSGFTLTGQTR